jgi:hypothetical protein
MEQPNKKIKKSCTEENCEKHAQRGFEKCWKHGGYNNCIVEECVNPAQKGFDKCRQHGGCKMCIIEECKTPAINGFNECFKHGGHKKCAVEECNALAKREGKCQKHGKKCVVDNCETSATNGFDKCYKHGGNYKKKCVVEKCDTVARPGFDKCCKHGGGKRCSIKDCKNGAAKLGRCVSHINSKICIFDNCEYIAVSGLDKCISHGGKKCNIDTCKDSALDELDMCSKHNEMSKIPMCIVDNCGKIARSGYDKCFKHGGRKKCSVAECEDGAISGYDKCFKHGGCKKCVFDGCKKGARNGYDKCLEHGGGKICIIKECKNAAVSGYDKCVSHGGGRRCPNCIDWPDSRGAKFKKYDGYCATCFKRLFPEDIRSKVIYEHTKEIRVRNFINKHFDGFIHDQPMYTGNCDCTHRRRIDHRKLINGTVLAIETDEFGHRSYDEHAEEIRYNDVYMIHSGKWIFIRFNPDDNYNKTDIEDKLEVLLENMKEQIDRIEQGENTEPLEIIKLFCK